MIPRIHQADQLNDDLWLVYFIDPNEIRFPIMRLVPVSENPPSCPGGEIWCKQFGCVPGDNVFTRAEPVLLVEEGKEAPSWSFDEDEFYCQECDVTSWKECLCLWEESNLD